MTCRTTIAVLLCLALAPAASAAQRTPRFYRLGVGAGPAVTDGKRYVAFPLDDWSIAFYDFGVRSPSERVLRAPPCVESDGSSYPSLLGSIGDGKVVWDCESFIDGPLLEDFATTHASRIPLPPSGMFGDIDGLYAGTIGTSWIEMSMDDHGVSSDGYYNRASGAWRREPTSATRYPNLDGAALAQRLCRPLRRSPTPSQDRDYNAAPYEPYFYERPYGVTTPTRESGVTHERITVQRCGSHKSTVIGRCRWFCSDVQFSGGLVTWVNGGTLRAYAPRTGARYTWPPATIPVIGYSTIEFGHTHQRLIASTPRLSDDRKVDVFAARMPAH